MNLLFIGYVTDEETSNILYGASVAGNKMQLNILKELSKQSEINLKILSIYPTAPFPKVKELYVKRKEIILSDNLTAVQVGFLNVPIIKQFWQVFSTYSEAIKIVKNQKNTKVLTFNSFMQVGIPALWLKKRFNSRIISILADLPIDSVRRNVFGRIIMTLFLKITKYCIRQYDSFVVLNKNATKFFSGKRPYIVVEGGVSVGDVIPHCLEQRKNQNNILFTGALTEYNGIIQLIEAMKLVNNKELELHIYGYGPLEEYIIAESKNNKNIKFFGRVSNQEVIKLQKEAFLLINPRQINDPISLVTFPSKTFEYLLSGTPVISTRLSGFTDEYCENMFITEGDSAEKLAKKINEVSKMSRKDLDLSVVKAREFILKEKTWEVQGKRIYEFISTGEY